MIFMHNINERRGFRYMLKQRQIGYARVSSSDQNEDRQIIALTEAGIKKDDIFMDKEYGRYA